MRQHAMIPAKSVSIFSENHQAQKANDSDIAGRILAEFLRRAEAGISAALDKKDLVTARTLVNGGSHGLDSYRTASLWGQEVYCDNLRLVG